MVWHITTTRKKVKELLGLTLHKVTKTRSRDLFPWKITHPKRGVVHQFMSYYEMVHFLQHIEYDKKHGKR